MLCVFHHNKKCEKNSFLETILYFFPLCNYRDLEICKGIMEEDIPQ